MKAGKKLRAHGNAFYARRLAKLAPHWEEKLREPYMLASVMNAIMVTNSNYGKPQPRTAKTV